MKLEFKIKEIGKRPSILFEKGIPGWKRFATELIKDRVILDIKNAKKMLKVKGDLIVYEVYHLWKGIDEIKKIYQNTGIVCDLTLLNFGVFSSSNDGELFLTYGHMHEEEVGEAYTVLKGECFFVLSDINTNKTYILRRKKSDSILIHPKYLHRIVCFKKSCLVLAFVPERAGHNYDIVKNKGFPFHLFYKSKKLRVVRNRNYKRGEFELVKKVNCRINPIQLFERAPKKLKDILENPEKYRNLYFIK